jgi:hypothetical protein
MRVIVFGATGMVGASVLREALNAPEVEAVLLVRFMPFVFTASENLGRAMLRIVEGHADRFILESTDINRLAVAPSAEPNDRSDP